MTILVDMDGVLADIDHQFNEFWHKKYPDIDLPDISKRKQFYIGADLFSEEHREKAFDLFKEKGYYRHIAFNPGAKEAMKELWDSEHEIYIVTSASNKMPLAPTEKYQWVSEYLGVEFVDNLIICRDKSMIRGDILIDDKPEVRGEENAQWEHILFDQPYNQHITDKKRLNWSNYKEILGI